jgi:hypothetical protein
MSTKLTVHTIALLVVRTSFVIEEAFVTVVAVKSVVLFAAALLSGEKETTNKAPMNTIISSFLVCDFDIDGLDCVFIIFPQVDLNFNIDNSHIYSTPNMEIETAYFMIFYNFNFEAQLYTITNCSNMLPAQV